METESPSAPPVVAVVVVHEPGDWFDETLDALAQQDYPNLRFLFLVTESSSSALAVDSATSDGNGSDDVASDDTDSDADSAVVAHDGAGSESSAARVDPDVAALITARLPKAFVRSLGANPGFGVAANEVLRLVEGANGFFLFCHDDIAPEPDAVRLLVEEMYRSNAGLVGPKFVDWDDPGVLQTVGLDVDRFGEVDHDIEDGEVDQEQHDGVRDVFVLPTACLLARADLFRELDGFDPGIDLHGEDLEFCWRVHHSGARVVVAPTAKVRHRGELAARRPDLGHRRLAARHRLRSVVTLTGGARLPGRLLELVLLTVAELVVGLFTGRFRSALASARAFVGLVPRLPSLIRRRRVVSGVRRVPEREVLGLQKRGSARLTSFLRSRETSTFVGAENNVRRWRQSTTAPVFAWIAVLAAIVFGSRSLLGSGIPSVGEFLPFPDSPRDLFASYVNGWDPNGFGATSPNPTGWATLSVLSFATLFRMGLLQTVFVIGLVVVGLIGLWRLATVFPSTRARIAALVVYAASPLVGGALAIGSLTTLVAYASVPWFVHTLRRAVGTATADPRTAHMDVADGLVELAWPERLRRTLHAGLVVALAAAFVPVMLVVTLLCGVVITLATLLALAPISTAVRYATATVGAVAVGALLNLPWIVTWSWDAMVGPTPVGDPGRGLFALAAFEIGPVDLAALTFALYLPVVAALLLAQAWRLTWAVRSAALVVSFGALAVLGDRGAMPFAMPEAGVLLAPVAVGLAVSAAAALAAFDLDVRGASFGWKQPLGLAASAAVVIGLVPGVLSTGSGSWNMPSPTLASLLDRALPAGDADGAGDYNVLLLGDARLLPVPGREYRDGVSYAVIDDDGLDVRDRWAATGTAGDDAVVEALDLIASGSTQRAGRLLAPLAVRFVVIPRIDGVLSTASDPLELPIGLNDALDEQLDIVATRGLATYSRYRNNAWIPTVSVLTGPGAESSRLAGPEALVRSDLSGADPVFLLADHLSESTAEVPAGVVHLAVPFDDHWRLTVDGVELEPRRAFGLTTAFDVPTPGTATLAYETSGARILAVVAQVFVWLLVLFGAVRVAVPTARRRTTSIDDETLISLDADAPMPSTGATPVIDPGLDLTGQVARIRVVDDDGRAVTGPDADVADPMLEDGSPDGDRDRVGSLVGSTDATVTTAADDVPWADSLMAARPADDLHVEIADDTDSDAPADDRSTERSDP